MSGEWKDWVWVAILSVGVVFFGTIALTASSAPKPGSWVINADTTYAAPDTILEDAVWTVISRGYHQVPCPDYVPGSGQMCSVLHWEKDDSVKLIVNDELKINELYRISVSADKDTLFVRASGKLIVVVEAR